MNESSSSASGHEGQEATEQAPPESLHAARQAAQERAQKKRKGRASQRTPQDLRLLRPRYLLPQHWPFWIAMGLLRLVVCLPHRGRMACGRGLGRMFRWFGRERRMVAKRNLQLAFPDMSDTERRALIHENFESLGIGLIEIGMAWWLPDEEIESLVEVEGRANLEHALDQGKGALLLTCHMSCQELGGRMLTLLAPDTRILYREDNNPMVGTFIRRARRRHAADVIDNSDMRGMVRALRDGAPVWYAPDQDVRPSRGGIFAPFLGVDAATTPAAARLAGRTGCAVVPYCPVRTENGYRLIFEPMLEDFPGPDIVEATGRMNAAIESFIRRYPAHYFWVHKRFKSRPEGEPNIYKS